MLVRLILTGSILAVISVVEVIAQTPTLDDNPLNDLLSDKELAELCIELRKNNAEDDTRSECSDSFIEMALGNDEEQKRAFAATRREAEAGIGIAQFDMGSYYLEGNYVDQDYEKAFYWFHRGAKNCDAGAQFNLAYLYTMGVGIGVDLVEAYKWLVVARLAKKSPNRSQVLHNLSMLAAELDEQQVVEAESQGEAIGKACASG